MRFDALQPWENGEVGHYSIVMTLNQLIHCHSCRSYHKLPIPISKTEDKSKPCAKEARHFTTFLVQEYSTEGTFGLG